MAVGFAAGPAAGLTAIDMIDPANFPQSHLLTAARAEFHARLGERDRAVAEFERALAMVPSEAERRHLERRLCVVRDQHG